MRLTIEYSARLKRTVALSHARPAFGFKHPKQDRESCEAHQQVKNGLRNRSLDDPEEAQGRCYQGNQTGNVCSSKHKKSSRFAEKASIGCIPPQSADLTLSKSWHLNLSVPFFLICSLSAPVNTHSRAPALPPGE